MIYFLFQLIHAVDLNQSSTQFFNTISQPNVQPQSVIQAQKDFASSQQQWSSDQQQQTTTDQQNTTQTGNKFSTIPNNSTKSTGKSSATMAFTSIFVVSTLMWL